jgi:hypothetical protein
MRQNEILSNSWSQMVPLRPQRIFRHHIKNSHLTIFFFSFFYSLTEETDIEKLELELDHEPGVAFKR